MTKDSPSTMCVDTECNGGKLIWNDGTELHFIPEVHQLIKLDQAPSCINLYVGSASNIAVADNPCGMEAQPLCYMQF